MQAYEYDFYINQIPYLKVTQRRKKKNTETVAHYAWNKVYNQSLHDKHMTIIDQIP